MRQPDEIAIDNVVRNRKTLAADDVAGIERLVHVMRGCSPISPIVENRRVISGAARLGQRSGMKIDAALARNLQSRRLYQFPIERKQVLDRRQLLRAEEKIFFAADGNFRFPTDVLQLLIVRTQYRKRHVDPFRQQIFQRPN